RLIGRLLECCAETFHPRRASTTCFCLGAGPWSRHPERPASGLEQGSRGQSTISPACQNHYYSAVKVQLALVAQRIERRFLATYRCSIPTDAEVKGWSGGVHDRSQMSPSDQNGRKTSPGLVQDLALGPAMRNQHSVFGWGRAD